MTALTQAPLHVASDPGPIDGLLELSVVVPTFNEARNIPILVERIDQSLAGIEWELIVVDDNSPDGTAAIARELARRDRRVRVLHRVGRRGLASACIEGMLATSGPCLAVIDGDLQHDETLMPEMLGVLRAGTADCVVGSRYQAEGGVAGWDERRVSMSRFATQLAKLLTRVELSDPMSGFFMIRRDAVAPLVPKLSGVGFKILLDIMLTAHRTLRVAELPYHFRPRERDESKFDTRAAYDFAYLILDKTIGRWVPTRFFIFSAIGGLGVVVHLLTVWIMFALLGMAFITAQIVATLVAMTSNFLLNNELTYRDRRLRGMGLLRGWVTFALACAVGAIANVGIAAQIFAGHRPWWLAALGGVAVGAVWNYAVTRVYTWSDR